MAVTTGAVYDITLDRPTTSGDTTIPGLMFGDECVSRGSNDEPRLCRTCYYVFTFMLVQEQDMKMKVKNKIVLES